MDRRKKVGIMARTNLAESVAAMGLDGGVERLVAHGAEGIHGVCGGTIILVFGLLLGLVVVEVAAVVV